MSLDLRQDRVYRRGLILGLTMAEVMILLIFVLLMALSAALANRDHRLKAVENGDAGRLVEAIQRAYPEAKSGDDYYKELTRAIEARQAIEAAGPKDATKSLLADAAIGRQTLEAAKQAGASDPAMFAQRALAKAAAGKKGEWPPFFNLSEAGGFYFDSGKATLRPEFARSLRNDITPMLARNIREYDVDVVEVIGHTDEVPMVGASNLDAKLIAASASRVPIAELRSTDNAGLAMARAVAVVHALRADPRLKGTTILPLSGAQMIVPVDRVADGTAQGSDQQRRRIEIRLRRSTRQASVASAKDK
jgi:flagellar motor protein MotB